jgi:hypothetical protein
MSALSATKPLAVETATNSFGGLGDKATWYKEAFATLLSNMTRVQQATFVLRNETVVGADYDLNTANETAAFGKSLSTLGWSSISLGSSSVASNSTAPAAIAPIVIPTTAPTVEATVTAEPTTVAPTGRVLLMLFVARHVCKKWMIVCSESTVCSYTVTVMVRY